jgi:hypothetical protein
MKNIICSFSILILIILSSCTSSYASYYEKRDSTPIPGCDRNAYLSASYEFERIGSLLVQALGEHNTNNLLILRNELLTIPIPECLEKAHIYNYMAQGFLYEAIKCLNNKDDNGFQLNIKIEERYVSQYNAEMRKADALSLKTTK